MVRGALVNGVLEVDNFGRVAHADGDDIEPDMSLPVGRKDELFRGIKNAGSLSGVYEFFRKAISGSRSCFYFDKQQPVTLLGDEINLALSEHEVSLQDGVALFREEPGGDVLALPAGGDVSVQVFVVRNQ